MLVLTRRPGELVVIDLGGGRVVGVEVLDRRGDVVRLGFTAPPDVRVDRAEVYDRKRQAAPPGEPT